MGSAALDPGGHPEHSPQGFCMVGNDNFALYTLSSADVSLKSGPSLGGVICSSPAILYLDGDQYCYGRWVYVLSRAVKSPETHPGTLLGLVQYIQKN